MSECLPGQIQTPAPSLGTPSFLPPTLIKLPQVVLLNFKCPHTPLLFECAHTYPVPCSEVNTGHSCNLLAGFHFPLLWGHLKGHCVYTHTHTPSQLLGFIIESLVLVCWHGDLISDTHRPWPDVSDQLLPLPPPSAVISSSLHPPAHPLSAHLFSSPVSISRRWAVEEPRHPAAVWSFCFNRNDRNSHSVRLYRINSTSDPCNGGLYNTRAHTPLRCLVLRSDWAEGIDSFSTTADPTAVLTGSQITGSIWRRFLWGHVYSTFVEGVFSGSTLEQLVRKTDEFTLFAVSP